MTSEDNPSFNNTLKILRKVLFNYTLSLAEINKQSSVTSEYDIDYYARQEGYPTGLEYLRQRFTRYVIVQDRFVKGIPEALYDTEAQQRIYNLHVRTKNPNAKQLTMATRADDTYQDTLVQPALAPRRPSPAPTLQRQPFAFEGSINDVEITRLSQSDLRVPPMPRRSPHPSPGSPVGRDYYDRQPVYPDSPRRGTGPGFNIDEHKYISPSHAAPSNAYEDNQLPEQLSKSEEMLIAQRVSDIFPEIPTKSQSRFYIKSEFSTDINSVASALLKVRLTDFRISKPCLLADQTPREYYKEIVVALCQLTDGGTKVYNDSLANAIALLPWQIHFHEDGRMYDDLIRVLRAIPDYFDIYVMEKYNIPIYGIIIKLPISSQEASKVIDHAMTVIA